MRKLVVVAMPEAAIKIVSLDDSTPEPLPLGEWMCWSEEIVPLVGQLLSNGVLADEIVFFGPQVFVQPFMDKLKKITSIPVVLGDM